MADVVKKHSISSELAQKMVGAAVAKARELGVSENVAILDDGGNLMAFSRMDGAPILSIEMAQNKAYTALFGVSTQDFFIAHFMFPFGRRPTPPTLNFAAICQCFRRLASEVGCGVRTKKSFRNFAAISAVLPHGPGARTWHF
jgi:hypothetical protein